MYSCFIITSRNLMMTLEEGRIITCLLPPLSALTIETKASLRTLVFTIVGYRKGRRKGGWALRWGKRKKKERKG